MLLYRQVLLGCKRTVAIIMSDAENEIVCFMCEKPEENPARLIDCSFCSRSVHFRCKRIFGNAVARTKKKPFFCTLECSEMHGRANRQSESNNDIINELKLLGQSVREIKQESVHVRLAVEQSQLQMKALIDTSKQIEKSQEFLANQFDELRSEFIGFKSEVGHLKDECTRSKQEICEWQRKHMELSQTVTRMEIELDKVNRSALSKNAVMIGVPAMENENIVQLVQKIGESVNCPFHANDIVSARRLFSKNAVRKDAPILVTFCTEAIKEEFFQRKRQHGVLLASTVSESFARMANKITVRDEMTAFGRELLLEAKKLQDPYDIKYVWLGRNGVVLLKRSDGAKIHQVTSKQQLDEIMKTIFKRSLDQSRTSSLGGSPSGEPSAKR